MTRLDVRRVLARSRPRFWLYLAGPALVGVAYAADGVADLRSLPALALVAYFLVPANVYLYGVNDVYDADVDAENPKKENKEVRYRGERGVVALVALTGVLGLGLAAWLPRAAPWILGFLALGWAYSAPPRLKTKPPLDSLSNGLYVLPGVAAYAAVGGALPPLLAVAGGWLWTMAMHTFSAIPDIAPDRRAGIDTTATVLGERRALAYCGACWLCAAGAFALLDLRAGFLFGLYPVLALALDLGDVDLSRAYWWFPALNTVVGGVLACAGLWGVLRG
ncbi:4-hydroxybenzoate polyprenyltransferase [Halarchaeum rubridurum]|uniref:Prenyltransferase n=1 Tax=Halarchaeum rubridurum TaxID=489911 RepID=A0A830FKX5_9EURY|nr:prenyltransferase [Halarchaeum rubridurum]MBP1954397.1 4-hydroxybenzoate polyprenyltransferase [Halarchaeum rubridurum]GGM60666.1 prenyltransferase [Halarchaeum rubridurum]